jgi:hypothetical protein
MEDRPDFDLRAWMSQLPPMDLLGARLFQVVGQQEVLAMAERWRPYCSLAASHLSLPAPIRPVYQTFMPPSTTRLQRDWTRQDTVAAVIEIVLTDRLLKEQ